MDSIRSRRLGSWNRPNKCKCGESWKGTSDYLFRMQTLQKRVELSTAFQSTTLVNMSRQSTTQPRNLTLTEELEKLEQSITLTLQGKDFSPQIPRAILIFFVQKSTTISAAPIALLLLASSQLLSSTQNIPKRSGRAPRLAHCHMHVF